MTHWCEFDDCPAEANGVIHAQWTVVDFVEYAMCFAHRTEAAVVLENRLVDGQPPVDVWWTTWSPAPDEATL